MSYLESGFPKLKNNEISTPLSCKYNILLWVLQQKNLKKAVFNNFQFNLQPFMYQNNRSIFCSLISFFFAQRLCGKAIACKPRFQRYKYQCMKFLPGFLTWIKNDQDIQSVIEFDSIYISTNFGQRSHFDKVSLHWQFHSRSQY